MRLTENERERFDNISKDIINSEIYKTLQSFIQHGRVTTYEHSISVAECAFVLNRKLHFHADEEELVRACLLHDFYMYDWHTKGDRFHGCHHPGIAAEYAVKYFNVNEREESAIRTHMWPLTFRHIPSTNTAWLLTIADKICAVRETFAWDHGSSGNEKVEQMTTD
jgi:uncharacterized protein